MIYQSLPQLAAGTSTEQRVACPAGKAASAGGFHASGSDTFATRSAPSFSGDLWAPGVGSDHPNEWTVGLRNDGSTAAFPAAWVVCIDLED